MTALDVRAARVRASAAGLTLPKFSTVLITLIGLVPFLLAWCARAVVEFLSLVVMSAREGWDSAGRQMGGRPSSPGGS